ncbi:MAG: competence protein ComEC [Burkholderiaceae bacterium]
MAPSLAIVQAGYRNRFRHPAQTVLARYEARGIQVLRTDRDGAVTVTFRANQARQITLARDDRRCWRVPID